MTLGPGLDDDTNTVSPTFLQKADREIALFWFKTQKVSKGKQLNKLTVDVKYTVSMFTYCILKDSY